MKRDMDLVRALLLDLEDRAEDARHEMAEIDGYSEAEIGYHNYLIMQAGLADGVDVRTLADAQPKCLLLNLTWEGHEWLDAARPPKRSDMAKRKVLVDLMKQQLELG